MIFGGPVAGYVVWSAEREAQQVAAQRQQDLQNRVAQLERERQEQMAKAEGDRQQSAANAAQLERERQSQAANAARLVEQQRKADEKQAILANPAAFLQTSDLRTFDKGIINTYAQLVGVTVLNRSHFAVTNIQGDAIWSDAEGRQLGSTTFAVIGSIPAGDTKIFATGSGNLTSGTLQGAASNVRIVFTHVEVID